MNTTATRPITKAGIVKFAGEFYRVSRLTSKTVNLASIFGGTVRYKAVLLDEVTEAHDEWLAAWRQSEGYACM